jgi:hypothetical protein
MHYSITFFNDMGHLNYNYTGIPDNIVKFALLKSHKYIGVASDKKGKGRRFYYLKPDANKQWNYKYGNDIVSIHFNVDEFDDTYMKLPDKKKYVVPINIEQYLINLK